LIVLRQSAVQNAGILTFVDFIVIIIRWIIIIIITMAIIIKKDTWRTVGLERVSVMTETELVWTCRT